MNVQAEDEALFWIARESTGSMRDAYTLFDQVSSFSGGNIRTALIKEKLGLLGIEELNALADACADNNTADAFAVIDRVLEDGIAIEQFVIDLAGYYRSLLLLKTGITKESLLGYGADRFSVKIQQKLSLIQVEQGLSILLGLYRDIRYSLSPRFELETAVSKLCWLDKWVSPVELRNAVEAARSVLGAAPPAPPAGTTQAGSGSAAGSAAVAPSANSAFMDKPGAFTEGFKEFLAKQSGEQPPPQSTSGEAELVRRVFRGTYVNQEGNQ
jgi:DNA polymerase-3 subunit gamma/tau